MLFRFLPRLAVQRPVLATMLILIFVVLGTFSLTQLRTELYPDVEFPVVSVTTAYPGAGPEEVEIQVTEPIEDAVSNIANLNNLTSFSRDNVSIVVMEFDLDVDPDLAAIDVKDQVDAIRAQLPDGADPPVVQKFDINQTPILNVALSGPQGADLLFELADDQIRERLSRMQGVADISVVGGRVREVEIRVDPVRLEAYDVTLPQIVNLIRSENVTIPSGTIRDDDTQTSVRVVGEYRAIEELSDLRLFIADDEVVRLGELATIQDGYGDRDQLARAQGQSAVSISVQRQTDANTVETVRGILAEIDAISAEILPPGAELTVIQDGSLFIQDAVRDVLVSILFGIVLTTLILFLFLHSWRGTIIAAVAMPATILSAFLLIDLWGFSLNVMTLLALGVTVGILVTNTIVVLENIYRYLDMGASPEEAAEEGTAEIGIAVAASALTNVVVFTPIAFMEGIIGQFFYAFGLTVVFATVFSLLISFILAPLLGARLLRKHESRRSERTWLAPIWRLWDRGYNGLQSSYQTGLGWALHRPRNGWFVIAGVVVFFAGSIGVASQFVGGEFLPQTDEGIVQIDLELPTDVSIDRTEQMVMRAEGLLAEVEDVESILSTVAGGSGFQAFAEASNRAQILMNLSDNRRLSTEEVIRQVRPLLAVLPDTDITVQMGGSGGGPTAGADILIQVSGPPDGLEEVTEQITGWVSEIEGLTDVGNTIEMPRPEIVFRPDRAAVGDVGLTVSEIGTLVRSAIEGEVAGVYRDEGDEIDIRVRFPEENRREVGQIESLMIPVDGGRVPLSSLGSVTLEETAPAIRREDRQRAYDVEADIGTGTLTDQVAAVEERLGQESLPPGYSWETGGEFEDFEEALVAILRALLLAIILTYIVLAMILESFVHPVTIMLTLPLGAAGAFLALMLANVPLNIFAMMAVVMLVGIVVNNAILILDYAGQLRQKGKTAGEALLEAGPVRLRPIIMSNVAIAVALLPQAMGSGAGAAFRIPMAVVTIGGAAVAAVFTLFLIPVIYLKVETLTGGLMRRLKSARDRVAGDDDFDEEEFAASRTP